jgi:hypothetical protein
MLIALDISGPAEAKVGQEILLVCNATTDSLGDDNITWLKNGQMLRTSSRITMTRDINVEEQRIYSKLYIRDMKIGDKGTYTFLIPLTSNFYYEVFDWLIHMLRAL